MILLELELELRIQSRNVHCCCFLADDVEMEEHIPTIDPLTKKKLVNPVRNKICNHVYEKSSITEGINMNHRMPCPQLGCGNKKFVCLSDLVEDRLLQKKLAHMRAQELKAQEEADESD